MVSKRLFEVDRELKDVSKQRIDIENDLRSLDNEFGREGQENYESHMKIIKEKEFDQLEATRHTLEMKLLTELGKYKEEEKKLFEGDLDKIKADFLNMADL